MSKHPHIIFTNISDGKDTFDKEFQTTFNSTFWEVYLYRVFKELDIYIDWHYPSPDFSLSKGENEFIVEAVVSNSADGKDPVVPVIRVKSSVRFCIGSIPHYQNKSDGYQYNTHQHPFVIVFPEIKSLRFRFGTFFSTTKLICRECIVFFLAHF